MIDEIPLGFQSRRSSIPLGFVREPVGSRKAKSRANLPGLRGDKVYTPSPGRSEGRRDQLVECCPCRAAGKTSMPTLYADSEVLISYVN
jgi:hypothetical protein